MARARTRAWRPTGRSASNSGREFRGCELPSGVLAPRQRSGPTVMLLRQRPRQSLFCGRLPNPGRFGHKQRINAEAIRARYLRADLELRWWTILDLNQ